MISKRFTPTTLLAYKATRDIFHSTAASRWLYGIVFVCIAVQTALISTGHGDWYSVGYLGLPNWIIPASAFAVVFLLTPLLQYLQAHALRKNNRSAGVAHTYQLSASGIQIAGDGFHVDIAWSNIVRMHVTRRFVLFFVAKSFAYFLPRDLFTEAEIDQLREWASNSMNR